jgi:hypothetical protein
MQKEDLRPIVKTVLAQISEQAGFTDIQSEKTLRELGFTDEAAIAELKMRVYRTVSGATAPLDFQIFFNTPVITLDSTVDAVIDATDEALMLALPGNDPTKPK